MKKFLLLIMAFVLMVSFAGCGEKDQLFVADTEVEEVAKEEVKEEEVFDKGEPKTPELYDFFGKTVAEIKAIYGDDYSLSSESGSLDITYNSPQLPYTFCVEYGDGDIDKKTVIAMYGTAGAQLTEYVTIGMKKDEIVKALEGDAQVGESQHEMAEFVSFTYKNYSILLFLDEDGTSSYGIIKPM